MASSGVTALEGARNRYISEVISQTQAALGDVPLELERQILLELDKTLQTGLDNVEERIRSYGEDFCKPGLDQERLTRTFQQLKYMEALLMQTFRNRRTELDIDKSEIVGTDVDDADYIHLKVFQLCQPELLHGVNIEGTSILDRLIQDKLLTDDEHDSIIALNPTSRRRNEAFLDVMRGRLSYETLMNNFIPAIGEDYPDVAKKLSEAAQHLKAIPSKINVCAVCNMKENVQVKHLAEHISQQGAVSPDDYRELRNIHTSNTEKWSYLLTKLTNLSHITEAIKIRYPPIYKQLQRQSKLDLRCNCSSRNGGNDNASCSSERKSASIPVSDVGRLSDLESLFETGLSMTSGSLSQIEYQVSSNPKGMAIIICNPKSNPHEEVHRFYINDAAKLYKTFQKLNFDTRLYRNISKTDMISLLATVAEMDHSQFDAFVCVIHTETKMIKYCQCVLDVNAVPVPFKELKDLFNASGCPTLVGKPKVFFIPSGERDNFMSGVKPGGGTEQNISVPTEADFLVLRATVPGFNVIGDDEFSGSLWVKKFTEIMDTHSNDADLVSCMTRLAADVSCQDLWGVCKQSPHIESSLRKPLFFREKIPDQASTE